jgi:hypothetical protein
VAWGDVGKNVSLGHFGSWIPLSISVSCPVALYAVSQEKKKKKRKVSRHASCQIQSILLGLVLMTKLFFIDAVVIYTFNCDFFCHSLNHGTPSSSHEKKKKIDRGFAWKTFLFWIIIYISFALTARALSAGSSVVKAPSRSAPPLRPFLVRARTWKNTLEHALVCPAWPASPPSRTGGDWCLMEESVFATSSLTLFSPVSFLWSKVEPKFVVSFQRGVVWAIFSWALVGMQGRVFGVNWSGVLMGSLFRIDRIILGWTNVQRASVDLSTTSLRLTWRRSGPVSLSLALSLSLSTPVASGHLLLRPLSLSL